MIKLLLVEDGEGDRELIMGQVFDFCEDQDSPFKIGVAMCLKEAKQHLDSHRYDLVLLDLNLPDAKDLEALEDLLKEYGEGTPIVVLCSNPDCEVAEKAVRMGARDYLVKAYTGAEQLKDSLRLAYEKHVSDLNLRGLVAAANV